MDLARLQSRKGRKKEENLSRAYTRRGRVPCRWESFCPLDLPSLSYFLEKVDETASSPSVFRATILQKCGVKIFSIFLCQRCCEIRREIFRATFSRVWMSEADNFTKASRQKRCEKQKISSKFHSGAWRWVPFRHLCSLAQISEDLSARYFSLRFAAWNDKIIGSSQTFSVALPAEPRGEKKLFFCANFGRWKTFKIWWKMGGEKFLVGLRGLKNFQSRFGSFFGSFFAFFKPFFVSI